MNSGIYSLIARDRKTNKIVVLPIEGNNNESKREKVNISSIDRVTSYFKDEQELAKRLYTNNYIDFIDADIYIRYKQNNLYIYLEPIYKNLEDFRKLITNDESTIELNNRTFLTGCDRFFIELNNNDLRKYILNSKKINLKLKEHIRNLYNEQELKNINFHKKCIMNDLSNYRTFRNLTFLIDEYYNRDLVSARSLNNIKRKKIFVEQEINNKGFTSSFNTKKDEMKESSIYQYAKTFYKEDGTIMEKVDLDQVLSLSDDEAMEFGIDLSKYNEYIENSKRK